jgi:hypothetical protein
VDYTSRYYDTGPDGGRFGRGLDLGAVWLGGGFEVGLGVNDIGTTFDWRVRESVVHRDSSSGDYVTDVVSTNRALTSTVPATISANAAAHLGRLTVAADVVHGMYSTTCHAGAETWLSNVALRAGAYLDPNQLVQFTAGGGVRFGRLGVDLALATNSRNLSRDRGLELGAGLAFYH